MMLWFDCNFLVVLIEQFVVVVVVVVLDNISVLIITVVKIVGFRVVVTFF